MVGRSICIHGGWRGIHLCRGGGDGRGGEEERHRGGGEEKRS